MKKKGLNLGCDVKIKNNFGIGKVIIGVKERQVNIKLKARKGSKEKRESYCVIVFSLYLCFFVGLIRFKRIYRFPTSFYYHYSNENGAASALAFAGPFLKRHRFFHYLLIPSHLISSILFYLFYLFFVLVLVLVLVLVHPSIEHSAL